MTILRMLTVVTGVAAASVAVAGPSRMSDTQFLKLNRCAALVASDSLGGGDRHLADTALKSQWSGRDPYISERGAEIQSSTTDAAKRAKGEERARLIAERDGVCQRLAPNSATTTMAHGPTGAATPSTN